MTKKRIYQSRPSRYNRHIKPTDALDSINLQTFFHIDIFYSLLKGFIRQNETDQINMNFIQKPQSTLV